jgi:RNA polymerase sigma factor (sigma-70 family)
MNPQSGSSASSPRTSETDATLVRRCLDGDREAWDRLVDRYRRLIYSIPLAMGASADDADDVFQVVALALLENLEGLRRAESLAAWLATTARRETWRRGRAKRRFEPLSEGHEETQPDLSPGVEDDLHRIQCQHALTLALESLDELCTQLLRMLFVEDPKPEYEEISARLGRPVGSLGPTRRRCLDKLRRGYHRHGGPEP